MAQDLTINYKAVPTAVKFHASDAFVRGIMGPVGSGKSTACCIEILSRALRQTPGPDGLRHSRWVVVRNTYRELEDTTLKTWLSWFPESFFGPFTRNGMTHRIRFNDVDLEVMFRALDRPDDIKKVLSLEITGAWLNEAREIPKMLLDALCDRVGRFPAMKDGGCTWRGVIMDTNPPDDDHWWYRLAEIERPDTFDFFRQPGGLLEINGQFTANPDAENVENLEPGYYMTRQAGKSREHVRVYYCAQYGFVIEGKPVVPEYVDAIHCASEILRPVQYSPVYMGLDFGLTPAAVFGQRMVNGRWIVLDELVSEDMGAVRFGEVLKSKMRLDFTDSTFELWGDPAGDQRSQVDERTPYQMLAAAGLNVRPAPSNDFSLRREAMAVPLTRLVDGKPGLILSPKCKMLRKGLAGGYCYKRLAVSGQERFHDMPDKNRFSHPVDALGYMMIGAGEGRALIRTTRRNRPEQAETSFNLWR